MKKSTLKKVLLYIKKYWIYLVLSLFFAVVNVFASLYLPVLTGRAVDEIVGVGQVNFSSILGILKIMGVMILLSAIAQWLMNICNNKITYSVVRDMRKDAFDKLQELPLGYLDTHSHGDLVSRLTADADQFAEGLLMGFTQFFTGVLTILGTLLFMLSIHGGITMVVVLVTPVSFLVAGFIAKRTYIMFQKQSQARGKQTAFINEMISNQKVVWAFGQEENAMKKFKVMNEELSEYSLKATFFSSLTNPCTRFVNSLVYTGVGFIGGITAMKGWITVGELSCFLSYANQYTKPFNEISGVLTELQNALACAARIFEFMEEKSQIPDEKNGMVLQDVEGNVQIDHVSFSYDKEKKLIEDFNLKVKPGQRIAIVGPTGCGKTTFINLLMRFYDVDAGSILVEQTDIRKVSRKNLRENYGMVLQETWLKSGTIRENLLFACPDASEEELIHAAKMAHAHSFIKRLPNGYDTIIGEEGGSLSAGQKQLLCIARVMLALPPMLILDEATSSIDTRTEQKIQNAFATMMQGRTSFIVAHRLSTIQSADVILFMKDGKIMEQGNHKELLEKQGYYAKLYNSQFVG